MLQHYQLQQSFNPTISADQLHQLSLLLRCEARKGLLGHEEREAEEAGHDAAPLRAVLAEQATDYVQLCRLQPGSPVHLVEHAWRLWMADPVAAKLPTCIAAVNAAKAASCEFGAVHSFMAGQKREGSEQWR